MLVLRRGAPPRDSSSSCIKASVCLALVQSPRTGDPATLNQSTPADCPVGVSGGRYDSRSSHHGRNHPAHRANDSIRRIFPADFSYESQQRIHGESAAAELFSRRACSCRSVRDPLARMPDSGRFRKPDDAMAMGRARWSADRRHSDSRRVFLLDGFSGGDSTEWFHFSDLLWHTFSRGRSADAGVGLLR
jgi:hypothetical protein